MFYQVFILFTTVSLTIAVVPELSFYNISKKEISLSGFSDGGFFGVQFHVAFSETIMGVGIAAGGPYWCAKGNETIAVKNCLLTANGANIEDYANKAVEAADSGRIDRLSGMVTDWVRLFSATNDSVVSTDVVANTGEFYRNFVEKGYLYSEFDIHGEHAMLTDNYGNGCFEVTRPFINNCGFSNGQRFIQTIYSNIKLDTKGSEINKNLLEFDQSDFIGSDYSSMDSVGYVYVPNECHNKSKECRLHLVFHGCEQGRDKIDNEFALHAEYNGIAEINNIIILYPQIKSDPVKNPRGCWDWIGYTNQNYIYKDGIQMAAVKRMIDRIVEQDVLLQ